MKLAIDARMVNSSGIGRYLRAVLGELSKTGIRDILLLGCIDELESWSSSQGWDVLEFDEGIYSPGQHFRFPLKKNSADVFYSPHITFPFFTRPGKKMVLTVHDCFHLSRIARINPAEKVYIRAFYSRSIHLADQIICPSAFTQSEIRAHFGAAAEKKVQVIYNTLEDGFRNKGQSSPKSKDRPVCLYVGNIKPHKNLVRLAQAFSLPGLQDVDLLIVGKKDGFIKGLAPEIQELMEKRNVRFTGFISDDDLKQLYTSCNLLVQPSLYEGFGLPPLEALGLGMPVVLSDIPVFRELYGDCAVFVDPSSPEAMAAGILKCLALTQAEREGLADAAEAGILSRTRSDYTSRKVVDVLIENKAKE